MNKNRRNQRTKRNLTSGLIAVNLLILVLFACQVSVPLNPTSTPDNTTLPTGTNIATTLPTEQPLLATRLQRLAHGINISRWFRYPDELTGEFFSANITDADLQLIHDLGFTHVRLAVDPRIIYDPSTPDIPDPVILGYLDEAVERILAHDLSIVIDLHDEQKRPVDSDPVYAQGLVTFWEVFARHFSNLDPDRVFLEALNEPAFMDNPQDWLVLQDQILAAMRRGAPENTLIATGPSYGSLEGLLMVTPVDDPNVVYSFHWYRPFTFTHQGAGWLDSSYSELKELPYPYDAQRCADAVAQLTDERAKNNAQSYCEQQWDYSDLDELALQAVQWSLRNNVPVWVGEFGAISGAVLPSDRSQWFRDVSSIFNRYGIGWTLWSYDESLGLDRIISESGNILVDQTVLEALGMPFIQVP